MAVMDEQIAPRRGPAPLPVNIGLAMAEYARLQQTGEATPRDIENMLAGIKKYQSHPFQRRIDPLPVIYNEGTVRVFHCAAKNARAAVLLVPSLINKSSILDLVPEKSFLRWLAAQNIDAYLLDWGRPVNDPALQGIDDLVAQRLCIVLQKIAAHAGREIHALGYCMGGTLLAAAAVKAQQNLRSVIFLASPWDFHAGDKKLMDQVRLGTPAALQMIGQSGRLPMDWIQTVFAAVNAGRAMKKFSEFAAIEDDGRERLFVAVEDWLNDGVDMPQALAKTCILDWYGDNKPGTGVWTVAGEIADLSALHIPALIMASTNDRLVPRESSVAMAQKIAKATVMAPASGHIGMITGRHAEEQVWKPVAEWIRA